MHCQLPPLAGRKKAVGFHIEVALQLGDKGGFFMYTHCMVEILPLWL